VFFLKKKLRAHKRENWPGQEEGGIKGASKKNTREKRRAFPDDQTQKGGNATCDKSDFLEKKPDLLTRKKPSIGSRKKTRARSFSHLGSVSIASRE